MDIVKIFPMSGQYRAGARGSERVFAMSYTMKVSLFLFVVIMTIIAAWREGVQFL